MEKFNSIELSSENTNPTSISKIYLEYTKHFSRRSQFTCDIIEKYIAKKINSFDADGDVLINQVDVFIEEYSNENIVKLEKEKLLELISIYLIKIPAAFSIQAIQAEGNGQIHKAWVYALDAAYWVGMLKMRELTPSDNNVLSLNGLKGATARLALCPKQLALKKIKLDYEAIKHEFKRKGFSAQFARKMHEKYPEITAIKTIENLVSALNKDNELIPR